MVRKKDKAEESIADPIEDEDEIEEEEADPDETREAAQVFQDIPVSPAREPQEPEADPVVVHDNPDDDFEGKVFPPEPEPEPEPEAVIPRQEKTKNAPADYFVTPRLFKTANYEEKLRLVLADHEVDKIALKARGRGVDLEQYVLETLRYGFEVGGFEATSHYHLDTKRGDVEPTDNVILDLVGRDAFDRFRGCAQEANASLLRTFQALMHAGFYERDI